MGLTCATRIADFPNFLASADTIPRFGQNGPVLHVCQQHIHAGSVRADDDVVPSYVVCVDLARRNIWSAINASQDSTSTRIVYWRATDGIVLKLCRIYATRSSPESIQSNEVARVALSPNKDSVIVSKGKSAPVSGMVKAAFKGGIQA